MENRIARLLAALPDGVDAALINSEVNRRYFTGMSSSAGTLLAIKDAAVYFLIDFRYIEKARETVHGCEIIRQLRLYEQLSELIGRHGVKKVAVEGEYMTLAQRKKLCELIPAAQFGSHRDVDEAIRRLRMIKSSEEIAAIRAAQRITDGAFSHICGYIKVGMTEREIAGELLDYTYRHGSERPAFDYIVVSGKNSSKPHGVPTDKAVDRGDFVTMDFGCVVDGYHSDMTRTVAVGKVSDRQKSVYDTVLAAQLAALSAVRAGVKTSDIDAAARDLISGAGYGDCFGHSTGHSVGLEIHEAPSFAETDVNICESGMIMTVEPGIYIEGEFGVRIEDMVVVTEGGAENLTASGKELVVLD